MCEWKCPPVPETVRAEQLGTGKQDMGPEGSQPLREKSISNQALRGREGGTDTEAQH